MLNAAKGLTLLWLFIHTVNYHESLTTTSTNTFFLERELQNNDFFSTFFARTTCTCTLRKMQAQHELY